MLLDMPHMGWLLGFFPNLVFHVTVLMADEGIDWSEIEGELAKREK